MGQAGSLVLSQGTDAKNDLTTRQRSHCPQKSTRETIKYPRMACRYPWAELDSHIEVFGDVTSARCISTRKSTVGGVALWSVVSL